MMNLNLPHLNHIAKTIKQSMKFTIFKTTKGREGFSLLELLVVIAVIGILSSIIVPVGTSALGKMREVKARKTAVELRTAIMNYYAEYKKFPPLTSSSGSGDLVVDTFSGDGSQLLGALLGVNTDLNPRQIPFLALKPARRQGQPGLWSSGGNNFELLDPFQNKKKNPYFIAMDTNHDNKVNVPVPKESNYEDAYVGVAVWNPGRDGEMGSSDDINAY